jgi:nitrite reductase/ring-hydroxylating ferredoxin subunit
LAGEGTILCPIENYLRDKIIIFFTYILDWLRKLRPVMTASLPHVASYTRELPISLTRMYENAIDFEHLPWLHSTSFSHLEILDKGDWGWRAKGNFAPKSFMNGMELELRLDREKNRWITRTTGGLGKGTEVWTHAFELEENKIKIVVDFYIPKLPVFMKSLYDKQLVETYAKLYDEDLWMMATRQNELDRIKIGKSIEQVESVELGSLSDGEKKLPLTFTFNNNSYKLVKLDGELLAFSTTCPHMLGPLQDGNIHQGIVECPWHGYKFDVRSRECISGAKCKLAPAPNIFIDEKFGIVLVSK